MVRCFLVTQLRCKGDVVGATKLSHIDTACKACDLKLTVEEMKYLEECYKPHPLVGVMKENNQ